jgi:hypothetical protein
MALMIPSFPSLIASRRIYARCCGFERIGERDGLEAVKKGIQIIAFIFLPLQNEIPKDTGSGAFSESPRTFVARFSIWAFHGRVPFALPVVFRIQRQGKKEKRLPPVSPCRLRGVASVKTREGRRAFLARSSARVVHRKSFHGFAGTTLAELQVG